MIDVNISKIQIIHKQKYTLRYKTQTMLNNKR